MKYIEIIAFFILFLPPVFSLSIPTLSYWVDSEIGANVDDCGVDSTAPCRNLTFAFTRAKGDTNTSSVWVEFKIHGNFSNDKLFDLRFQPNIIITSDDESVPELLNCLVYGQNAKFRNVRIAYSRVYGYLGITELFLENTHILSSYVSTFNKLTAISSYLWNTSVSITTLNVSDSTFSRSPVSIYNMGEGVIRASKFENSVNQSALSLMQSSCEIYDSTFENNLNPTGTGGAISANSKSVLRIFNSNFTKNQAYRGGAILTEGVSDFTIENSIISENSAFWYGGGIYAHTSLVLNNTIVSNNQARIGGGLFAQILLFSLTCQNSKIVGNSADQEGGGIYIDSPDTDISGSNCQVTSNYADLGGGLHFSNGLLITGMEFYNNSAKTSGAGVYGLKFDTLSIFRSNFHSNQLVDGNGGSIYVRDGVTLDFYGVTLTNSKSGDVVLIGKSYDLEGWRNVSFLNPLSSSPFLCDDCSVCPAAQSCLDCSGGCMEIGQNSTCLFQDTCSRHGKCTKVQNKQQKCICNANYTGDSCQTGGATVPFDKKLIIIVSVVGGVVLIAICVIIAKFVILPRMKKGGGDYTPIK